MADDSRTTDQIDINGIMQKIPHRYPFLMVDKVIELVPNESAVGVKCVSVAEPHFQGHFPSRPIMPGVLIIEAMAQTSAVLVCHTLGTEAEKKLVYFMSIDAARFRKPVVPGDVMHIHVIKKHARGAVWRFEGKAMVDGKVVADATFAAMLVDR